MTTATGFSAIVGQAPPISQLKVLLRNGTLPHALLFTGDDGVGKRTTALALAMACNCKALKSALPQRPSLHRIDACGECTPCRKIAQGHHPDIIPIAPSGSVIRIDRIRSLLQLLSLKPNEADRRVVILTAAQTLNPEAGNALLKVLEEPPDRTLLILTAGQTSDLLPTVVSRCRHIRFLPLQAIDIKRLLMETDNIDDTTAETVAGLCGGSYSRARKWIDPRWLRRRGWIIAALRQLTGPAPPDLRTWLAFSEVMAKKKDLVEESLEITKMWLRDLIVVSVDPQRVLNRDRLEDLIEAAAPNRRTHLIEQIEAVDQALTALKANANTRLTLDAMVLKMAASGN